MPNYYEIHAYILTDLDGRTHARTTYIHRTEYQTTMPLSLQAGSIKLKTAIEGQRLRHCTRHLRHSSDESLFEFIFSDTHMFGIPVKSFSDYNL